MRSRARNKIISLVMAVAMLFTMLPCVTLYAAGSGTAEDPYIITTAAELDAVRDDLSAHYKLGGNVDLFEYLAKGGAGYAKWGGAGWEPIGTYNIPFTGSLDGAGYLITGLWINRSDTNYVGLFGYTSGTVIKDIGMALGVDAVNGKNYVGGLAGVNYDGSIANSYVRGGVTGENYVGGLAGQNSGRITNSYTACGVNGQGFVGGLAG